jgi:long-chain acyl-CoA synthetase
MLALNSDHYLQYYLACAWTGILANPVNFRWSKDEIIYSLIDSNSVPIIFDDQFIHLKDAILEKCPSIRQVFYAGDKPEDYPDLCSLDQLVADNAPVEECNEGGDATFGIFYTGGTTGFPKGVLLSHNNLCTAALGLLAEGCFPESCAGIHAAPMFHLADMAQTMSLLLKGGTHVFEPAFSPANLLSQIEQHQISDLLLVPTMLQMAIDSPEFSKFDTSSLQRVYYGGSPFTQAALERAIAALPDVEFRQVYGMTESSAILTVLPPNQHLEEARDKGRARSAGRPAMHVRLTVFDNQGEEAPLGNVGEIVFKSPGMMQGYLNKPEETQKTIKDGWLHTGDMGYLDSEGFLYIVDRSKDMIISGGENIYGTEVENAIGTHPAVATSAVIGVPDDKWGETVHAVVVLKEGQALTLENLVAHCKTQIAGYKCPRSMEITPTLPMTGAGKVKKNALRDSYLARLNNPVTA